MSYQTTLANAKARAAEHEFKLHKRHCPQCSRKGVDKCAPGAELYQDQRTARSELREERRLDKLPIPGQGTLI